MVCISCLVMFGLLFPFYASGQNAPIATIGSTSSYTSTASISVTAVDVNDIGSFSLKILYDPAIVQVAAVVQGPLLGGNMSVNLNNPGVIFVSWYTTAGVTLSGTPVIFTVDFNKVAPGTSALTWLDEGISCSWYNSLATSLTDTPFSNFYIAGSVAFLSSNAPHTIAPEGSGCLNSVASIPVRITGFQNIGKVSLKLNYNATAAGFQSYTNTSGFPGLLVDGSLPGTVLISGIVSTGGTGVSLADSTALVTLNFMITGGSTDLVWADDGQSCQYSGAPPAYFVLTDTPQNLFYVQGSITASLVPAAPGVISGPTGGNICAGQSGVSFSVSTVQNADTYTWSIPPDAMITSGAFTNNITVTFGSDPGNWDVTVFGSNACGNGQLSPSFPISINAAPAITAQPVSPAVVNAGNGSASFSIETTELSPAYQWQEYVTDWSDLSDSSFYTGTHSATMTISNPPLSMNGFRYRCIVSGLCPPAVTSNGNATLFVSNLTGTDPEKTIQTAHLSLNIFPNPIVSESTLQYYIPNDGQVGIEILNLFGARVNQIANNWETAGTHEVKCRVNLDPGLYYIVLTIQSNTGLIRLAKKIILN